MTEPASPDHERYAAWDGGYVVGALLPAERAEFERHLASCAECRRAVSSLASLPGLLARVDPEDAAALLEAEPLPDHLAALPGDLEQRVLAAAGHPRPTFWRRTSTRVGLGLAAAAVVAAGVVPLVVGGSEDPGSEHPGTTVAVALRPRGETPLTADVALVPTAWGTKVDMTCWYAREPYDARHSYALYVVDGSGGDSLVARWHARPGQRAETSGATDLGVGDIAEVELRDGATGAVLLAGRPGDGAVPSGSRG